MDEGALVGLLRGHAAAQAVPGVALGVLVNGEHVVACGGVSDVRTTFAVSPATRFGIGSLTKSMVASALVVLASQHLLSLEDPVASWVPELRGCAWAESSTLRDLLANRSRVPLRADLEFGFEAHAGDDDRALARLVAAVAAEEPAGDHWSYANAGWCVLGRAIETATEGVWDQVMPRVLAPAGLTGTAWRRSPMEVEAVGHDPSSTGPTPVEPLVSRAYAPAGATVTATIEDMLRYAAWHLADPALAALRVVHAETSITGWCDGWGLGLGRFDWNGVEVWGWDGIVNGQRSVLRLLPELDGAVVVLTNGGTGRALARDILADVVPALFGVDIPGLRMDLSPDVPQGLGRYAGTYGWPDRTIEVTESDDVLRFTEDGVAKKAPPLDHRTFLLDRDDPDAPTITFEDFDSEGKPGVLYDMVWGLGRA